MDIHLTKSYCIKLGFAKFVSWIGMRCLRESNELEWIVGEDCFTANTAIQSMAKKVIQFLEPIYHFEVRDVNYKTMNPVTRLVVGLPSVTCPVSVTQ